MCAACLQIQTEFIIHTRPMSESLSGIPCCLGLCEAPLKYLRSTVRACLFPMMHLPISSLAQSVKEAIVPVTLRHVSCTYDTEWEKLFPLYPWNFFESTSSM